MYSTKQFEQQKLKVAVAGSRVWNSLSSYLLQQDSYGRYKRLRNAFLSRVSTLTGDIDIANVSVCPFVRPYVRGVPVLDENGLTYCYSFSSYGSLII